MEVAIPEGVAGVSRHHATITMLNDRWEITDAGSRNGTFVNNRPIQTAKLSSGDEIQLGPLRIMFRTAPHTGDSPTGTIELSAVAGRKSPLSISPFAPDGGPQLSCSINIADLAAHRLHSSAPASRPSPNKHGESSVDRAVDSGRAWAIGFFTEIGRALVVSNSLDEMLENVLTEVFKQIPAERGAISLLDADTGKLVTMVSRSDDGLATVKFSQSISKSAIDSQSALLIEDTSVDSRFADAASIKQMSIRSAMCVPLYSDGQVRGIIYVDTKDSQNPFSPAHLEILSALAVFSAVGIQQAALRDRVLAEQKTRERLARYSSPAVLDRIMGETDGQQMLADSAEVSVLFADLKGFTSLSERKSPEDVVRLLNSVFTLFTKAVFANSGTLDKFMGDGMLAFFGAPLRLENHAACAVKAAVEMNRQLQTFNQSRPKGEEIGVRIGINTGMAIVGDIGSSDRKDYTVIGDTVNVASRFESSVATPGDIVIGPMTYEAVRSLYAWEVLPPITLKGKKEPVAAFRLRTTG